MLHFMNNFGSVESGLDWGHYLIGMKMKDDFNCQEVDSKDVFSVNLWHIIL